MKLVKKNKKGASKPPKGETSRKNMDHLDKQYDEKNRDRGSNMGNYLQDRWFPRTK